MSLIWKPWFLSEWQSGDIKEQHNLNRFGALLFDWQARPSWGPLKIDVNFTHVTRTDHFSHFSARKSSTLHMILHNLLLSLQAIIAAWLMFSSFNLQTYRLQITWALITETVTEMWDGKVSNWAQQQILKYNPAWDGKAETKTAAHGLQLFVLLCKHWSCHNHTSQFSSNDLLYMTRYTNL